MLHAEQVEELICLVAALDREAMIARFQTFEASFPIDFTPEFLENLPTDRLRHIFLAMCLQCQRHPFANEPVAA